VLTATASDGSDFVPLGSGSLVLGGVNLATTLSVAVGGRSSLHHSLASQSSLVVRSPSKVFPSVLFSAYLQQFMGILYVGSGSDSQALKTKNPKP